MKHPITVTVTDSEGHATFSLVVDAYSPQGAAQLAASVPLEQWNWDDRPPLKTVQGDPITIGGWYYDNNLDIIRVTALATTIDYHENEHRYIAWHRHDMYRTHPDPEVGIVISAGGIADADRMGARSPFTPRVLASEEAERLGYAAHAAHTSASEAS